MGFIVAKMFHGRSMKMIFSILTIIFFSDLGLVISRYILDDTPDDDLPWDDTESPVRYIFSTISGVLIFLLYFLVCMLGIVDLVKVEQLQTNRNLTALLIFFVFFYGETLKAIFIPRILLICDSHYILWASVDQISTTLVAFSLYPQYKIEAKELFNFNKLKKGRKTI
jgi:hypothetical protein